MYFPSPRPAYVSAVKKHAERVQTVHIIRLCFRWSLHSRFSFCIAFGPSQVAAPYRLQIVGMEPETLFTTMAVIHGDLTWHGSIEQSSWHRWKSIFLKYALQVSTLAAA